MKKLIAIILALILVVSLVACGRQVETPIANPEPTAAKELPVKVGFIYLHDEQSTYDLNFLTAAKEACEQAGVEYINKTGIDEGAACYEAACELADNGCNIVFADSFGHEDYMIQAAREFPNVQFCHATGTKAHTENLPNYHNAFAAIYEGRFLAGIAAGMKLNEMIKNGDITKDNAVIGYIGAYPYAEVISGYTSFFLGARYMCPDVTMKVQYTGSWYDETLEKEAANHLMDLGCVLISQHADSMGAPSACELRGVPNVSYNGSTIDSCSNKFIVSSRIDWTPYFLYIIDCVKTGQTIDTDWTGTLATKSVAITDVNTKVAAEGTIESLDMIKTMFNNNELHVFDVNNFTVNGQNLTEYFADVDTDADFTPDTNVIKDGYFHESEYRSAPYFDIIIDGIEIIT